MNDIAEPFLEATIRTATPLGYAALGELIVERAGIVNIGLEGIVLAGAFGALVGGGVGGPALGYTGGIAAGAAVGLLFAAMVLGARANQIVAGAAVTLFILGATGTLYREIYGTGGAALSLVTSAPVPLGPLREIPVIGTALFHQPLPTYGLYALVPILWCFLYRTHAGLALRATGEAPEAAAAAGVATMRIRWIAIVSAGALGGLGGATLVLAQAGTFAEGMSAGRGFIAIAIVALGRWHPLGVALGALVFGAATALQFLSQTGGESAAGIPYQLFLALPYVLTLLGLALIRSRAAAPAALGRELG